MSVTGDSNPTGGGLEPVPAGNMPATQHGQMPPSDAGAALSPEGAALGAGTSEGGDQPESITAEQIRKLGHFTRDDYNRATATLTQQKAEASRQATEFQTQAQQAQSWGEQLHNLLVEQGVDQEELQNLRLRFDANDKEQRQAQQQEAQQFAQSVMQKETSRVVQRVRDAAFDETGRQLFDPNHPEIAKAANGYLAWVNHAAANQTDDNVAHMENAGRYVNAVILRVMRQSLAAQGQSQEQAAGALPPPPPERGRQVAGARGGGGSAGVKDVHANALAAGDNPDDAFFKAMAASLSS